MEGRDTKSETIDQQSFIAQSPFKLHNRTSDDIRFEILDAAKNGALFTQIMYRCNLSFTQTRNHLAFLTNNEYLALREVEWPRHKRYTKRITNQRKCKLYTTTEKGKKWLQVFRELKKIERER